ncbi:MAG: cytochrome C oxidase subunit IV family protein [Chloroflexia bacterium]|jgi:cytochrome c oxidase subunit 4|nr:cytochrome C oxidase subunit IV family protein [Chloroflexia bacterium]
MAAEHHVEEHHPGWQEYVRIGVILAVITAIEVAIVYVEALESVLLPLLLTLSVGKFVLVVMYFMHLKFDHKFFTWLFLSGLLLAVGVVLALMAMFGLMT